MWFKDSGENIFKKCNCPINQGIRGRRVTDVCCVCVVCVLCVCCVCVRVGMCGGMCGDV